jgi:glycosyltransferase involved in cell wall biosynthesis
LPIQAFQFIERVHLINEAAGSTNRAPTMLSYRSAVTFASDSPPDVARNIALDGAPLTVATGGIARYTSELTCALARRFPDRQYWLLCDRPFPMPDDYPPNLRSGEPARGFLDRRWWSNGVQREMKRAGIGLFHGTDFVVPYLPLRPSVMTIHDLSPWINRGWQQDASRVRRRTAALLRARVPTVVITPTEAIRGGVIERFGLAPDRVVAIPLAASEHFRPIERIPKRPYFLFVGTLEPRKNISALIEAWRQVRKKHDVDLMIAGRRRHDFPAIVEEPGLRLLGAVPDIELPVLYSNALAVVYPSLYEGFGLPVLEAMQCGTIVVTSRDPAIMEVASDGALCVDDLVEPLREIAADPSRFTGLRNRALARAKLFSWRRAAELTQDVYDEALRRFKHV